MAAGSGPEALGVSAPQYAAFVIHAVKRANGGPITENHYDLASCASIPLSGGYRTGRLASLQQSTVNVVKIFHQVHAVINTCEAVCSIVCEAPDRAASPSF